MINAKELVVAFWKNCAHYLSQLEQELGPDATLERAQQLARDKLELIDSHRVTHHLMTKHTDCPLCEQE